MKPISLNTIRQVYLDFFESKGHLVLPSASLVPKNDPSILLINAGMTPFKKYFTGAETPPSLRIATCQKCIRTPDIDRVGKTSRHGTYFEMLGNFSFGDYFKQEAIAWAWELITDVFEMPYDNLSVTVFEEDDEAYHIWHKEVGLPEEKIFRLGKEDNFWEHGVGPCGPCSEIFYDRGLENGCGDPDCQPGCECDRFVEFWNLVFTQFNREEDGSYTPLEKKNIDTGGGLERFATIMQGVDNLFEVDTIQAILDHVCSLAKVTYGVDDDTDVAIRVITDHMRSAVMMLSDGVLPGNEGRGYVLRRLIRRAVRFGRALGLPSGFMTTLVPTVMAQSVGHYTEMETRRDRILMLLSREETKFAETLSQGLGILDHLISKTKTEKRTVLDGNDIFVLHDTYGFPLDLSRDIAEEHGMSIDLDGFEAQMTAQKEQARRALKEKVDSAWDERFLPESFDRLPATVFTGYDELSSTAHIIGMVRLFEDSAGQVDGLGAGDKGMLVLDRTPFYAEAGGQVGDGGRIESDDGQAVVLDTTKTAAGLFLHKVEVEDGALLVGQTVKATVDRELRLATARNHTTTHLLHKALRTILGDHVEQAGSEVSPGKLRFDFTHFQPISHVERMAIEAEVNKEILKDELVKTDVMPIDQARSKGALALFEEKYADEVRVVSVGDYSMELCGGTHLERASQAGYFRITAESSIASGIRRIEAVTGDKAVEAANRDKELLHQLASLVKTKPAALPERLAKLGQDIRELKAKLESYAKSQTKDSAQRLVAGAEKIKDVWVVIAMVNVDDVSQLRDAVDRIRDQRKESVIVLAAKIDDKLLWIASASDMAVATGIHAGKLVKLAAELTGGRGGGKPSFAQAGSLASADAIRAMAKVKQAIRKQLEEENG